MFICLFEKQIDVIPLEDAGRNHKFYLDAYFPPFYLSLKVDILIWYQIDKIIPSISVLILR